MATTATANETIHVKVNNAMSAITEHTKNESELYSNSVTTIKETENPMDVDSHTMSATPLFSSNETTISTINSIQPQTASMFDSSHNPTAPASEAALNGSMDTAMPTDVIYNGNGNGNGNDGGLGIGGLSLMQSSPPPHSYRHSRAYRHFKNPPQPHMCIRTTTEVGEELFINVLSWTRIVIPQEPSDPIPLYGGMRVPPGSPRSPPIVFAVMANPEVLKDSGRHSKDPEERRAMIELMCDFVEAMNPGVKLVRNAVILKDRDISGELKDVWNAVQAQRDREREEQMMQQRQQQQHYHSITTQQMFPKSSPNQQKTDEDANHLKNLSENEMMTVHQTSPPPYQLQPQQLDNRKDSADEQENSNLLTNINANANNCDDNQIVMDNLVECMDQLDAGVKKMVTATGKSESNAKHTNAITKMNATNASIINANKDDNNIQTANNKQIKLNATPTTSPTSTLITSATTTMSATISTTITSTTASSSTSSTSTPPAGAATIVTVTSSPSPATTPTPAPTKKEKLGGFLPNGCIFPRFKNNKHKDKDKEKETKSKDKEKTLLNALKVKSKDKKIAPIEQSREKTTAIAAANIQTTTAAASSTMDTKSQYEKNCINLESEVQKLDLNKIDTTSSNDNMFIKLKVTAASATAAK